jgi:hypothetical protein
VIRPQFTMTFTTEGADALTLEPLSPSKEWKHVLIEVRGGGQGGGGRERERVRKWVTRDLDGDTPRRRHC